MRTKQNKSFNRKLFGKRLRDFRQQLKITGKEFAEGIDRTRSAYVVMEAGRIAPSMDCAMDIIEFLRKKKIVTDMNYLAGITSHQNQAAAIKELKDKYDKLLKDYESTLKINHLQEQLLSKKKG
jgi:DNA-binding XRE family transcriptional regulator